MSGQFFLHSTFFCFLSFHSSLVFRFLSSLLTFSSFAAFVWLPEERPALFLAERLMDPLADVCSVSSLMEGLLEACNKHLPASRGGAHCGPSSGQGTRPAEAAREEQWASLDTGFFWGCGELGKGVLWPPLSQRGQRILCLDVLTSLRFSSLYTVRMEHI